MNTSCCWANHTLRTDHASHRRQVHTADVCACCSAATERTASSSCYTRTLSATTECVDHHFAEHASDTRRPASRCNAPHQTNDELFSDDLPDVRGVTCTRRLPAKFSSSRLSFTFLGRGIPQLVTKSKFYSRGFIEFQFQYTTCLKTPPFWITPWKKSTDFNNFW